MAVKIRLSRIGTTNRPFYRIIATDSRAKRDGAVLATVGTYDPFNGSIVTFSEDIYKEWLSKGAIATDSAKKVYRLFQKAGSKAATASGAGTAQAEKAEQTA